jgi:hypothetical protein
VPADSDRIFVISPFLDAPVVRRAAQWGGPKTHRAIVSTAMEFQRLLYEDETLFEGFNELLTQPLPDLPAEGADLRDNESVSGNELLDGEEPPPAGLHAKLLFAAKGARRQLWLGSANATKRGWEGGNFESVGELALSRAIADALQRFIANCERFHRAASPPEIDAHEEALEKARKSLSGTWPLRQQIRDAEVEIIATKPPPLVDSEIKLEVAVLGGAYCVWRRDLTRVLLSRQPRWQRSAFVQIRVSRGDKKCAWLQIAPCEPPPDDDRDRAVIAQYLDARTFLLWLRSMLTDEGASAGGGECAEGTSSGSVTTRDPGTFDDSVGPTIEEILRAWALNPSSFIAMDEKVKAYMGELQRRAYESGAVADSELLKAFHLTWNELAAELR